MTLEQIVARLDELDDGFTICAAGSPSCTPQSPAELYHSSDVPDRCELPYFLEVSVAKNVLHAWSYARSGKIPDLRDKCRALIYYAENDAYMLPEG